MITEVSSNPRAGSAIGGRIDHGVQIRTEPAKINPGSTRRRGGNGRPGNETMRLNWPEFGHRCAVACHNQRLPRLYFPEHAGGVVAQFSLGNDPVHILKCSKCSIL